MGGVKKGEGCLAVPSYERALPCNHVPAAFDVTRISAPGMADESDSRRSIRPDGVWRTLWSADRPTIKRRRSLAAVNASEG